MFNQLQKLRHDKSGQSAVIVAIAMVVLLGLAAFTVDIGLVAHQKSELQNAADAAALAGAQDLPIASTAKATAKNYAVENGAELSNITVTTPYDDNSKQIEVVCTETVSYSFARILGLVDTEVSVYAVAQNESGWDGEALPFINLDFDYSTTDPTAWTDVGEGIKGTITDFYTINSGFENIYFDIEYEDGITVKPGFANAEKGLDDSTLKEGLKEVITKADENIKVVYLFSLRADIIQGRTFTVNNKTETLSLDQLSKLKNGDVIDPDQLVLIECRFLGCDNYNNQHSIELQYLDNVFDLGNDNINNPLTDFPTENLSTAGVSKLVK